MKKRNLTYSLIKIAEECGEVVQMCSKCIFYGIDNVSPKGGNTRTNRDKLIEELGDVLANIKLLIEDTDSGISKEDVLARRDEKYAKLDQIIPEA